jgi:hypothetical protein
VKLWDVNRYGCNCIMVANKEFECREKMEKCRYFRSYQKGSGGIPIRWCRIKSITTVTDHDGNKFRVLLVDDRACQGGGCCVTCGKKGGETIDR